MSNFYECHVDYVTGEVRKWLRDCVSEVDWSQIALDYLCPENGDDE